MANKVLDLTLSSDDEPAVPAAAASPAPSASAQLQELTACSADVATALLRMYGDSVNRAANHFFSKGAPVVVATETGKRKQAVAEEYAKAKRVKKRTQREERIARSNTIREFKSDRKSKGGASAIDMSLSTVDMKALAKQRHLPKKPFERAPSSSAKANGRRGGGNASSSSSYVAGLKNSHLPDFNETKAACLRDTSFLRFTVFPSLGEMERLQPWKNAFNRCHSKFLKQSHFAGYEITQVDVIFNGPLLRRWQDKRRAYIERFGGEDSINHRLLFHGTGKKNINPIVKGGFDISKVGSSTDAGFYGRGIYFSENTDTSVAYARGTNSLLMCDVLIGRPYQMRLGKVGCALHEPMTYTSHVSDARCSEVIIFDMDAIYPAYVVHFRRKNNRVRRGGAGADSLVGLGVAAGGGVPHQQPTFASFSGSSRKLGAQ